MQILLKEDVPNLGQAGDIKNVKTGYARNYLIPNSLVIIADARSQKERSFLKQVQERKIVKRKREAREKFLEFKDISVNLEAKLGSNGKLYGSISNIDIYKALTNKGIYVDRRMIVLDKPIRTLGTFKVPIKLYQGVAAEVQVIVVDEQGHTSIKNTQKTIENALSDVAQEPKKEASPPPLEKNETQSSENEQS